MRRAVIPALLAASAAVLSGCTAQSTKVNTTPVNAPTAAASTSHAGGAAPSTSAAKTAHIGDTIDLTGDQGLHIQVTLVKVVDPAKSTDEFMKPDAGKHYVAVQLRIQNVGSKAYSTDPMGETKAKDAQGESFDADISPVETAVGVRMDSGLTLAQGDKSLGVMTVTVPDGTKLTTLQYTTNSFVGNVAQWMLG